MTDLVIDVFGDSWVNEARPATRYGGTKWVRIDGDPADEQHGYVLPALANIAGRTVLDATLVGHAGTRFDAQTITVSRVTERWSPGNLTWNNAPSVSGSFAAAVAAAADGDSFELSSPTLVTWLQAVADGTDWFGLKLQTDQTVAQVIYSADSGEPAWELHVSLSDAPEQPSNLRPDGGGAVESTSPVLAWDALDLGGEATDQAQLQVQVDTPAAGVEPDEVAPDYDSGVVTAADPQFSLATLHTLVGAGPHYWRVQVTDADGNASEWSDWAEFTVGTKPTLVIDAPTGAIGDPAPTVIAHLSSGTLKSWKLMVTGPNRSDVRYRTGMQTGAINWQVPLRNEDGRRIIREDQGGWIHLRAWPDGDWAVAVGEQAYLETWIAVEFTDSATIAPTGLSVSQYAPGDPRLVWSWSVTDVPESFLIQVDGRTVEQIGADDLTPVAGVYTWTDDGLVSPLRTHTLQVRAVSDAGRSTPSTVTDHSHTVKGMWLIPDAAIDPIVVNGTSVGDFSRSDAVATYTTQTGDEVDVIYGHPGRVLSFAGTVDDRDRDVWDTLDRLDALKVSKVRTGRLVWGSESVRGRFRDVQHTPSDNIREGHPEHVVKFGFVEAD